jgi:predicted dehydrogenase
MESSATNSKTVVGNHVRVRVPPPAPRFKRFDLSELKPNQKPPMPSQVRPIVVIGAGAIVKAGHLPAYRLAGFPVSGLFDINNQVAAELAKEFEIPFIASSLEALVGNAPEGAVFDLAVPASAITNILEKLPNGVGVLIQKPMGETWEQAQAILDICRKKQLTAAVNFQLRYAPYIQAAREMIQSGLIGEVHELEIKVNVHMPWEQWPFLEKAPRMEIYYHSIHYLDLVRSFLGNPRAIQAKAIKHPDSPKLESSRSAMILDYGDMKRALIITNHGHKYGPRHQESYVRWEGSKGAIKAQMGLNMNYPVGASDYLEVWMEDFGDWQNIPLEGSWFPHAFIGTMASVMLALEGKGPAPTDANDALQTMALVDAAYRSSDAGGIVIS